MNLSTVVVRIALVAIGVVLHLVALPSARAQGEPQSNSPLIDDAARAVHMLFEQRCNECHGAQLRKPKGKFGYILDLARVAANPDYVVVGKPGESEIYLTCQSGEMPPEDERDRFPELNQAELEILARWIELGAPPLPPEPGNESGTGSGAGTTNASSAFQTQSTSGPAKSGPEMSLEKQGGRAHPLLVHFPIALLLAALLAEFLYLVTRAGGLGAAAAFCTVLGALSAIVSCVSGWFAASHEGYLDSNRVLFMHRWGGIGVASLAVIAMLLVLRAERQTSSRWPFRLVLLVAASLVAVVGHYGGVLVYGAEHLPLPFELPFEGWAENWVPAPAR